jgi:hypothetical protein
MTLYDASGAIVGQGSEGCPDGPDAILGYAPGADGPLFVKVVQAEGLFGPGQEYQLRVTTEQGYTGTGLVRVSFDGNTVLGNTVSITCNDSHGPYGTVLHLREPNGYYHLASIETLEVGTKTCYAEATYSEGDDVYSGSSVPKQVYTSGTFRFHVPFAVSQETIWTGTAGAAAGRLGISPGQERAGNILPYLVPSLLLVGIWKGRRGRRQRKKHGAC